ncbi:hypothetical protein AB0K05_06100 [Nonomuraea sp. NPDC049486]|uniref:hypothetical protein n=1 Tax=unclassified Nonomuraea TaxID=2593643 RepID=UPI003448B95A
MGKRRAGFATAAAATVLVARAVFPGAASAAEPVVCTYKITAGHWFVDLGRNKVRWAVKGQLESGYRYNTRYFGSVLYRAMRMSPVWGEAAKMSLQAGSCRE